MKYAVPALTMGGCDERQGYTERLGSNLPVPGLDQVRDHSAWLPRLLAALFSDRMG